MAETRKTSKAKSADDAGAAENPDESDRDTTSSDPKVNDPTKPDAKAREEGRNAPNIEFDGRGGRHRPYDPEGVFVGGALETIVSETSGDEE